MEIITVLENELNRLKEVFQSGYELSVKHLPDEVRVNDRGRVLSGEVQGNLIIIYESEKNKAQSTLYHEFIEYCFIVPLMRDYMRVIRHQDKVIKDLLLSRKEQTVESLTYPVIELLKS